MKFEALPQDDRLWFVKWIDGFAIPHLKTRSSSVTLLLQRLPFDDPRQVGGLSVTKAASLMAGVGDLTKIPVLAGYLPFFAVGRVFQNGRFVGELPTLQRNLVLQSGKDANYTTETLDSNLGPQFVTGNKFDYRPLNQSEWPDLLKRGFSKSRCIVHRDLGTLYIIPLTVVFKCFYGFTDRIINSFCKGPWNATKQEIAYFGRMESGLETRNNRFNRTWDIVLQPKTPVQHAHMVAALLFDTYARTQAESLYTRALQERGYNQQNLWFCTAGIPFDTSREPQRLRVKGLLLARAWNSAPRKVLVTSILTAFYPSYFPRVVRWEKLNSGEQGREVESVDQPAPYSGASDEGHRPANSGVIAQSSVDSNVSQGFSQIIADEVAWDNAPSLVKLEKRSSRRYVGQPHPQEALGATDRLSAGIQTHEADGAAEAYAQTLIRDPEKRFRHLVSAFDALDKVLQAEEKRLEYTVFDPVEPTARAVRDGWTCWNFLDAESRGTGVWPRRGWRMIAVNKNEPNSSRVPRCALVIRVKIADVIGYWMEIETRSGSTSPFIITSGEPYENVSEFIEATALAGGTNLDSKLSKVAQEMALTAVWCYRHRFQGGQDSSLDVMSLYRFFSRCGVL